MEKENSITFEFTVGKNYGNKLWNRDKNRIRRFATALAEILFTDESDSTLKGKFIQELMKGALNNDEISSTESGETSHYSD